jgi:hypothetical protein
LGILRRFLLARPGASDFHVSTCITELVIMASIEGRIGGLCISLSSAGSQGEVLANWEIGASFASIERSYGRRIDCFGDGEV